MPDVICADCDAPMELRRSRYGPFWGCTRWPECDGTHGAHPDGRPLGKPADKETKRARIAAHDAFDALWKGKPKRRRARARAYHWLQEAMGLGPDDCHIGAFTKEQCERVVALCEERAGAPIQEGRERSMSRSVTVFGQDGSAMASTLADAVKTYTDVIGGWPEAWESGDEAGDIMGLCESCAAPITDTDKYHEWADGVLTCEPCSGPESGGSEG